MLITRFWLDLTSNYRGKLQKCFQAGRYGSNIVYIDVTIFKNLNRLNASMPHTKFMLKKKQTVIR